MLITSETTIIIWKRRRRRRKPIWLPPHRRPAALQNLPEPETQGLPAHLTAAAGANPTALSGNGTGTSAASSASAVTAAVQAAASASSGKLDWKQQKEEQTRLRKKQNELKRVEEEIHTLETRDQEIDALLCDETVFSDVPRLMELNKEKEELNAKLEGLYEKWEELAE